MTPPKILVVDDTAANLVAMRRLLARSGAQLFEASSGNEALALCLDHQFALILLDVNMPDMDASKSPDCLPKRNSSAKRRSSSSPPLTPMT